VVQPPRLAIDGIELDLNGLDCRGLGRMGLAQARKWDTDLHFITGTTITVRGQW